MVLLLGLASCTTPEFAHRVAVLRFEDLTPNPNADWIGRALSEEIAGQLEGTRRNAVIPFWTIHQFDASLGARPISAPGISAERAAAIAAGANRIVTGFYVLRSGQLSITAVEQAIEENVGTRDEITLNRVSGTTEDILHLADEIARSIDNESLPPLTGNPRTLRAYALGLESGPDQARALLTEAIQLDPDFGPAYEGLARMALAQHSTEEFARLFAAARARGSGVRPIDRALLNLQDAGLHAPLATRIDALGAVSRLLPADPFHLQDLGMAELQANRYTEAADHFRKLSTMMPASSTPLNLLGYALMYAGDEPGAVQAFRAYAQATGGDANALDSLGDAQFFFGHFADAGKQYAAAHDKNAELNDGCELLKAAWCRLMQRQGVEEIVRAYREERLKAGDANAEARAARVMRIADSKRADTAPSGDVARWRKLAEDTPPDQWWTRTVYARVLLANGQSEEAARYLRFTPIPAPARTESQDELWYPWILQARTLQAGK